MVPKVCVEMMNLDEETAMKDIKKLTKIRFDTEAVTRKHEGTDVTGESSDADTERKLQVIEGK